MATIPACLTGSAERLAYINEYREKSDGLWKGAIHTQLKTALFIITMLVATGAWIVTGSSLAATFYSPTILPYLIVGIIGGGILGLALTILGGIAIDLPSYQLRDRFENLNFILALEHQVRKEMGTTEDAV